MKLLRITALLGGLAAVATLAWAAPVLAANPYDWTLNLNDSSGTPYTYDVQADYGNANERILGMDGISKQPQLVELESPDIIIGTNGELTIGAVSEGKIPGLTTDLAGKANVSHTHTTSDITGLSSFVNSAIAAVPSTKKTYFNNVLQGTTTDMLFSTTTTGGVATFNLTTDGTATGTSTCPTNILNVSTFVDDSANTYGISKALTNSNKTLTVTTNVRSFNSTTILGITVLGTSQLSAAANGTPIFAKVTCN